MEQITVELHDGMTLGTLRALAEAVGRKLVVEFDGPAAPPRIVKQAAPVAPARPAAPVKQAAPVEQATRKAAVRPAPAPTTPPAAAPARKPKGKKKRNISPEARAIFSRNLIKARAAQAAKRKAGKSVVTPESRAKFAANMAKARAARSAKARARAKAAKK